MERHSPIVTLTCGVILAVLLGWLIIIGKSILLPIVIGVILVYILTSAAKGLGRLPLIGALPNGLRQVLVALIVLAVIVFIGALASYNASEMAKSLPEYSRNLETLFEQAAHTLGLKSTPSLSNLTSEIQKAVDLNTLAGQAASGLTGAGAFIATSLLYAMFLLADWSDLPRKMRLALQDEHRIQTVMKTMGQISDRIGGYLGTKTLINVILALTSYVIMWGIGIEYAVFWAILIGLLNYIPYIGSVLGVLFPVAMAVVQFGTLTQPLIALAALMAAQLFVGNVLEPKMLGRSVNMSPFVVLVALSFWMTVWGVIGAILAIPLTSMVMIILAEIPATRPIAVMMSGDGEV